MKAPKWIKSRYELIGKLGAGGSGRVYKAIDRKDRKEPAVAVKLLGQLPDEDRELQKEFFAREVRALSTLSHPTIVRQLTGEANLVESNLLFQFHHKLLATLPQYVDIRTVRYNWLQ
jgi:serine/threonine protein kinase